MEEFDLLTADELSDRIAAYRKLSDSLFAMITVLGVAVDPAVNGLGLALMYMHDAVLDRMSVAEIDSETRWRFNVLHSDLSDREKHHSTGCNQRTAKVAITKMYMDVAVLTKEARRIEAEQEDTI